MTDFPSRADMDPRARSRFEAFLASIQTAPVPLHGLIDPRTGTPVALDLDGHRRDVVSTESLEDPRPQGGRMAPRSYLRVELDDGSERTIYRDRKAWYLEG